jgi:hypothetical protein
VESLSYTHSKLLVLTYLIMRLDVFVVTHYFNMHRI